MASPSSPLSYPSGRQSPESTANRCETLSSASDTSAFGNNSPAPQPNNTLYTSVWDELARSVRAHNLAESEEKSVGDVKAKTEILRELTTKFDRVCDKGFKTLTLQPYYGVMRDDLKMAFYESYVWDSMLGMTAATFPGDLTALEDFKDWYYSLPGDEGVNEGQKLEEREKSDFDGGVRLACDVHVAVGLRVGDGETEDRYADGETESTDGGAKLRWY